MPLFLIIYCFLSMIFTTGLLIYHTTLVVRNLTTKEELKGIYKNAYGNPYRRSCLKNIYKLFCSKNSYPCLLEKIRRKINEKEFVKYISFN